MRPFRCGRVCLCVFDCMSVSISSFAVCVLPSARLLHYVIILFVAQCCIHIVVCTYCWSELDSTGAAAKHTEINPVHIQEAAVFRNNSLSDRTCLWVIIYTTGHRSAVFQLSLCSHNEAQQPVGLWVSPQAEDVWKQKTGKKDKFTTISFTFFGVKPVHNLWWLTVHKHTYES